MSPDTAHYPIEIRPARKSDMAGLQQLYCQTIEHTCKQDYNEAQRTVWKQGTQNEQRWLDAIENQYFLIAEIGNAIAGFGSLLNSCYIDFMYTSNVHLRKGVAGTIYHLLEKEAIQNGAARLTSDVSLTARPFFEKQGYTVMKTNRNLIRGIEIINYRMEKSLPVSPDRLNATPI
ncbi:GNAT family N-acetyltransferase [Dyadobacter sp. Leaf189]|uniref:GNAT family N-acetyltransferase n=1 Tax=Dyadobacter sp. Leaf189 TaxID=1736295 RepID=UPI0006F2A767|nr:GNAT family N-acetyltransferase [Dyadobacter sp. Leaf189]KQS30652.1 hypothetical protein ASG33_09670 [Dyadobacter sp. Leaf189]